MKKFIKKNHVSLILLSSWAALFMLFCGVHYYNETAIKSAAEHARAVKVAKEKAIEKKQLAHNRKVYQQMNKNIDNWIKAEKAKKAKKEAK